jgi:Raf kinase inhibitor-like YbhB/YbcL family protein
MRNRSLLVAALALLLAACGGDGDEGDRGTPAGSPSEDTATPADQPFAPSTGDSSQGLQSEALTPDEPMPERFTCDGEDVSPPLSWGDPPPGTQSLMLVMEDLDAPGGVFTHWLMHDLDVTARSLPEAVENTERPTSAPGIQAENDFGETGYGGPCPPPGDPHRYVFTLIYLDSPIELEPGATREEVKAAAAGHPIGDSSLTVTYQR